MYRFKYLFILVIFSGFTFAVKGQAKTDSARFKQFDSAANAQRVKDTALQHRLQMDLNRPDLKPKEKPGKDSLRYTPNFTSKEQHENDSLFGLYSDLADKKMQAKNYDSALYYYNKQLQTHLNPALIFYNIGNAEYMLNQYEKAVTAYDSCLKWDSNGPNVYLAQANVLMKLHREKEALADYVGALKNTKDSMALSNVHMSRGYIYLDTGQLPESETDFSSAIKLNPKNWQSWFQRAAIRRKLGKQKLALEDVTKAKSLNPKQPEILLLRGVILVELGSFKAAIPDLSGNLKLQKSNEGYYYRGIARLRTGQDSLAREDFTKILANDKTHIGALNGRSEANLKLKHLDLALKDNSAIIALSPKNGEAYANRAYIYTVMKNIDKACIDWHKAKDLGVPKASEAIQKVCGGK